MNKSPTLEIHAHPSQIIRLFVNKEIFFDQSLPFAKNKITLHYHSTQDIDTLDLEYGESSQQIAITTYNTYPINCNK